MATRSLSLHTLPLCHPIRAKSKHGLLLNAHSSQPARPRDLLDLPGGKERDSLGWNLSRSPGSVWLGSARLGPVRRCWYLFCTRYTVTLPAVSYVRLLGCQVLPTARDAKCGGGRSNAPIPIPSPLKMNVLVEATDIGNVIGQHPPACAPMARGTSLA